MKILVKIFVLSSSVSILLLGFFILINPAKGYAHPPDCSEICNWNTPCDTKCWMGGPATCADYGVCDWEPPPCFPNWIEQKILVGEFQVNRIYPYPPYYFVCEHYRYYDYVLHDTNGCMSDHIERSDSEYDYYKMSLLPVDCCDGNPWTCWGKGN